MSRVVTWAEALLAPLGPAAVAVGVFDGVHVGHQALLRQTAASASAAGTAAVALTFDRDPDQVVDPEHAAPQLLDIDDKLALIGEQGMDAVLVVPFDHDVAAMSPTHFLDVVLSATMSPSAAFVGHDFRFGTKASGDVTALEAYGAERGFAVHPLPLVEAEGAPVTSTRIRSLVSAGDVRAAARLLGRPHVLWGTVVEGRRLGREIGAPTANLEIARHAALPADGVYTAWAETGGAVFPAAVSCGPPPSFADAGALLEAHLIGFDGDLYGERLRISFVERLRDLAAFPSSETLGEAIREDIERVRDLLGG